MAPLIENRTYDEIEVGESAALERTLSWPDIELFAVMSGDVNPAHVDEDYARSGMAARSSARRSRRAPRMARPIGVRIASTTTASDMDPP